MVKLFIIMQLSFYHADTFIHIRFIDHHRLETSCQGSVLFNKSFIFVNRRSSDALDPPSCQIGLQNTGYINRTFSFTGTNNLMHLINKQYCLRILFYTLDNILNILCRKEKANPLLIGEAGVGKSAIVEKIAGMIEAHVAHTNSRKGKEILAHFAQYLPAFKKIIPADYKHLIQLSSQFEEQGMSRQEAQIEAFYAGVNRK